jgi:chaperonin GroEL
MTTREVLFSNDARKRLFKGAEILAKSVAVTMGAMGRNVVISRGNTLPHVTKDGVTVARAIIPSDPVEAVGASILREASIKTAIIAGDGTTTSVVLAYNIMKTGIEMIEQGENPVLINEGINKALAKVIAKLDEAKQEVTNERLFNVAKISANNDEHLGNVISEVIIKTGKYGIVKVDNSPNENTYYNVLEGFIIDRGYINPYYATNNKGEAVYEKPIILLFDMEMQRMTSDFSLLMESVMELSKPIVIIAREINGELESTLLLNRVNNNLPVVVIKAPNVGETQKQIIKDISIATGAAIIGEEYGLTYKQVTEQHFGTCEKITVTPNQTIMLGAAGSEENIKNRIEYIESLISGALVDSQKDIYRRRIANLKDGVGIIYAGATTEVELKEKKDRIDDAVNATKAAQQEGIVAGGGTTLYKIGHELLAESQSIFENIVYEACMKPLEVICSNAGFINEKLETIKQHLLTENKGFDVKSGTFVDMLEVGIIDPKKVTRVALENAVSVSTQMLITEVASFEINNEGGY